LSLSDYANQLYFPPGTSNLSLSEIGFMKEILRGDKISTFDGSIIANLASLMTPSQGRLLVKAARDFRVKDLQTDENFVFLGSARSNPWTSMFNSVLDFQFAFNTQTQREYVPTAGGFGTGESYAVISVFHNPGYGSHVLIHAGASGEAPRLQAICWQPAMWAAVLQSCYLTQNASSQSLQVLLQS
jgi:hypothetical protein